MPIHIPEGELAREVTLEHVGGQGAGYDIIRGQPAAVDTSGMAFEIVRPRTAFHQRVCRHGVGAAIGQVDEQGQARDQTAVFGEVRLEGRVLLTAPEPVL
jgi:hypothetical protein